MLTKEENDRLCLVGPGTPMGEALRRYWVPAFPLQDLPEPDGPPLRVRILGENLIVFRDTNGEVGVLDEQCCHRGASLVYGRVEECGIRCIYHGWKYDVTGRIVEMPNSRDPGLRERISQPSYPLRQAGGLGWLYLGPPGTEPPFPRFPWLQHAAERMAVGEMRLACNWLQALEGSIDSSHVGILHLDTLAASKPGPRAVGSFQFPGEAWDPSAALPGGGGFPSADNAPEIRVENTEYGFWYAAVRATDDPGTTFVRVTSFALPYTAHIGGSSGAFIVVPADDTTTITFGVRVLPPGQTVEPTWPTDEEGNPLRGADRPVYELPRQDRAAMASRQSFAGFRGGNRPQDAAVQGGDGRIPIFSRATEHLIPADAAVARLRSLLLESARLVEEGKPPVGIGEGYDPAKVQGVSGLFTSERDWLVLVGPDPAGEEMPAPAGSR